MAGARRFGCGSALAAPAEEGRIRLPKQMRPKVPRGAPPHWARRRSRRGVRHRTRGPVAPAARSAGKALPGGAAAGRRRRSLPSAEQTAGVQWHSVVSAGPAWCLGLCRGSLSAAVGRGRRPRPAPVRR
ncbi:hypothetical protein GCM10027440_13640 [Nocardiopsis coralliicola]